MGVGTAWGGGGEWWQLPARLLGPPVLPARAAIRNSPTRRPSTHTTIPPALCLQNWGEYMTEAKFNWRMLKVGQGAR